MPSSPPRRAALVTLGCARNEVDSEELAGRLAAGGWEVVHDPDDADAILVNTCGFVESAKKDSVDTLLAAADTGRPVVAVGCMAERYGKELAAELPEAAAVLGFDAYATIGDHLDAVVRGETVASHTPRDRRTLLPISPVQRSAAATVATPGHGDLPAGLAPASGPRILRRRLEGGPVAPLKLASGCDRRCAFCAIPSFRGSYVSRLPDEVLAEAEWLAAQGVRELVLVSENSTSYGKDFGDIRALEKLLPQLAAVAGIVRVRPVYLQPAEVRPTLLEALLTTPGVAPYLDLSFQHASGPVLRRMRRFGDAERFADLLATARRFAPELGARSNVILGFPGETEADVEILEGFLAGARLDAVGVFGYSDEDGTEAVRLPDHRTQQVVDDRVARVVDLVEQLTAARADERIGTEVEVLVETVLDPAGSTGEGRGEHQQPEVDGACVVHCVTAGAVTGLRVGDLVRGRVTAAEGVDLTVTALEVVSPAETARVPVPTGRREVVPA